VLNPPYLLTQFLEARADLQLASDHLAELVTNSTSSEIIQLKFRSILSKRERSVEQLDLFQNAVLHNGRGSPKRSTPADDPSTSSSAFWSKHRNTKNG
jgi:hypothetical protein